MAITQNVKELIRKFALKNALDYGKAVSGTVISRIIASDPSVKSNMAELAKEVNKTVSEINKLDKAAIEKEFAKYADEFKAAEAEKAEKSAKHNFSIEGAENGKFVTRFPPEPGGYMHIGHSKAIFVEDELRNLYDGKLYLYFDDTNPDHEKQEFVDAFHEDLKWLGLKFEKEYYASDNLPMLYKYAEEAIKKGKAYVCSCDGDKISKDRLAGKGCAHKKQTKEKNLELWKKMLSNEMKDNEAIVRLNSDMEALNTTMRDPTLFRIKHSVHYRQGEKYWVWPTYDFCTPIVDSVNEITDVLRSKEYELRDELYFAVLEILELRKPRITSFSRLEIADNVTSKRKVRELITQKLIDGWDDPRLVTIRALKRRGITPQAIREFALRFGMGKSESIVPIDMLLEVNRRLIREKATQLTFIEDKSPEINDSSNDSNSVRVKKPKADRITATNVSNENGTETPKIHSDKGDMKKCELWEIRPLLIDDAFNKESIVKKKGYIEGYAMELKEGDIVQFEKYGLYKLDKKSGLRFISL